METILTKIAELNYDSEESLLYIKVIKGADMNLKDTIEHYKTIEKITGGKKYLALVDATEYYTIDHETLKYVARPEIIEKRIASAHYKASLGNKLTLDFYKKFHKPSLEISSFYTKEEAMEWLKGRLKEVDMKN